MDEKSSADTGVYEIRVKGVLRQRSAQWFEGMTITPDPEQRETIISGTVIDQAALHSLLARIRDLGLPLLALTRQDEKQSEEIRQIAEEKKDD